MSFVADTRELATPSLLVDEAILDANLEGMARHVARAEADLWPHAKTHKTAELVRRQLEHGAVGVTAATLREAETFAEAGAPAVLIAYPPVGRWRLDRLAALARRTSVRVALDDVAQVRALDAACRGAGVRIGWLWEVDCGVGRCGGESGAPAAGAVAAVVTEVDAAPFAGLMTFAGHAYQAADDAELERIAADERAAVEVSAAALRERGVEVPALSIGTTPTVSRLRPGGREHFEVRPGNYVFNDASQVALGVAALEQCALSVLATVVSRPAPGRLILDCGSKALTTERPSPRSPAFGIVLDHPEVEICRLFEEHAIAAASPGCALRPGDRVRVVPNHACPVVNLHDRLHLLRDGKVVEEWRVAARGWSNDLNTRQEGI
ncbi:MAG: alanine racemase [Actinobacteria bacterium]|nr:alanine racemase [Actinomycetota bacterium]